MSFGGWVRRTVFWEKDALLHGGRLHKAYCEIKEVNTHRNPHTEAIVKAQISKLLEHARTTTRFYAGGVEL